MAKKDTNGSGQAHADATPPAGPGANLPGRDPSLALTKPAEEYRYEIRTPNPVFRGERLGVAFVDGRGYTDDGKKAHATLELGYAYTDRKTGKVFPEPAEGEDPTRDDGGAAELERRRAAAANR